MEIVLTGEQKRKIEKLNEELKHLENLLIEKRKNYKETKGDIFAEDGLEDKDSICRHSYIEVKCCYYKPLDKFIAAKIFTFSLDSEKEEKERKRFKKELDHLYKLSFEQNAPEIIHFYGSVEVDNSARIYMELMDFDLFQFYQIHFRLFPEQPFPENLLAWIAISILNALIFCKTNNIIHRDIKPRNILISRNGQIKLCDFGSSSDITALDNRSEGTYAYWAPELFQIEFNESNKSKGEENFKSEVWSLGITLWETAIGRKPYQKKVEELPESNDLPRYKELINNFDIDKMSSNDFTGKYTVDFQDFVKSCLSIVEERPNLELLKHHKFYTRISERTQSLTAYTAEIIKARLFISHN